jgi:LPXTG-site transpeptidase (sortase) family protein
VRRLGALKWRLLPLAIVPIVLVLPFLAGILNHRQITEAAQAAQSQLNQSKFSANIQGQPTRILIPNLSIDLPVVPQSYSSATKTWPVAGSEANYATNTAPINTNKGETLIYGHSSRHVFGPLLNMQPNDVVYVYTNNGHVFKYSYVDSQDVTPTQLSVFNDMAKAPAGLKLITCDGDHFQYRHLMSLRLTQAS